MSYDITQAVKITNASPNVDWYYGGDVGYWTSLAEAKTGVPEPVRMIGKTVAIKGTDTGNVLKEYWWKDSTGDNDLVEKSGGGGTVTGIKIGTTDYTPVSGIVTLPEYPTASSGGNTASWGSSVTVGTVGGVDLKFTMPSNPNTDHYDWSDITNKPLTLTKNSTGFSISGGTTSKMLTVSADYTLGAACAKSVTDNSSSAAVTSSDTNLITGRTLYYHCYNKGYLTSVPKAAQNTYGGAKMYASGDTLYITTT